MKWKLFIRLVSAYLILAAVGKAIEPFRIYRVLSFDGITHPQLQYSVAVLLVLAEAGLGVAGLIAPLNRAIIVLLTSIYSAFIVQLIAIQVGGGPNLCGCLGWFSWLFPEFNPTTGLWINAMIVGVCSYILIKQKTATAPDCEGEGALS